MKSAILRDAAAAPDLFIWNGHVERHEIEQWLARRDWKIPTDLLEFWTTTGGGEIFETERFLPPMVSSKGEDEVALLTAWCLAQGMPDGIVVFHEGFGFTAIRCADGAYISLDSDVRVCGEYSSFDDWYTQVLRTEFQDRYSLPPTTSAS